MANQPSYSEGRVDRIQVGVRVDLVDKYKIMKAFGGDGRTLSEAFIAAIKHSVEGVELSKEELARIDEDIKTAVKKRLENRARIRKSPRKHTLIDYSQYE